MTHLLDSNACIGYLNGRSANIRSRLAAMTLGDVGVCSVIKAEMFAGAMRSSDPVRTRTKQQAFFGQFVSLPFDGTAAEVYAVIRAHLASNGTPIGPYDLQIAAIALADGLTLVTHNTREFSRVLGLLLDDWEL